MTAIAVALLASLLVAVGVFLVAALVHEMSRSSRLRRKVRRRQAELRQWEDEFGLRVAGVALRARRSLAQGMSRVAEARRDRPAPIRATRLEPSLRS